MKKILLFMATLTIPCLLEAAEGPSLWESPWEDFESMQNQITALTTTQQIFKNALNTEQIDPVATQKWAQTWRSLSLSTDPSKNYPGFMRGLAENYRKCNFNTPHPPLHLCLGYSSLDALETTPNPFSIPSRIQKAHEAFEQGIDTEKNLAILKNYLIPFYQRLADSGKKPPFADFGRGKRDGGKEEFERFFDSVETLQEAQKRGGFRPLDRMGQVLRQSSIFIQDHHDFELAKAAVKGCKEFNKVHSAHTASWESTGITARTMKKMSEALDALRIANNPQEVQEAALQGLTLTSLTESETDDCIGQLATSSLAFLSSSLGHLAW